MKKPSGKNLVDALRRYFSDEQWEIDLGKLRRSRQLFVSSTRIVTLTAEKFFADQCLLRSSALTYITMLSAVPFLAVAFAATRAFGLYSRLYETIIGWVAEFIPEYVPLIDQVLEFTQNVNVNTIGVVGLISVLVSVILMLSNIEQSLNVIWEVKKARRKLFNRFANYLTALILVPVLIAAAVTVFNADALPFLKFAGAIRPVLQMLLGGVFLWLGIFSLYFFVPETRVRGKSALLASFCVVVLILSTFGVYSALQLFGQGNRIYLTNEAATSYRISDITFDEAGEIVSATVSRRGVNSNETRILTAFPDLIAKEIKEGTLGVGDVVEIAPSTDTSPVPQLRRFSLGNAFAQIPMLLLLIYIIWCILLGGAAFCYSHQNVDSYRKDPVAFSVSIEEREKIGLLILHAIGDKFIRHYTDEPFTLNELSNYVNAPPAIVEALLDVLAHERYILYRQSDAGESVILARPPEKIKLIEVVTAIRKSDGGYFTDKNIPAFAYYNEWYDKTIAVKRRDGITLADAICETDAAEEKTKPAARRKSTVKKTPKA